MARPTKCRRICHIPLVADFVPAQGAEEAECVILTVDEYESIRLIDKEGFSQEQCCEFMQVSRTTVQKIYESARKKLADVLVDGRSLRIEGGDIRICDGENSLCEGGLCHQSRCRRKYEKERGNEIMRIAVTYSNGQIFQHFGHTEQFKLYDVQDGSIVASEVVDTNSSGHGALAGLLAALKVDVLICGGIGGGAQTALATAGIRLYGGVSGSADAAVDAYLCEKLEYNPNVKCNHHDHEHSEGHTCGSNGCGSHRCSSH